MKKHIAILLGVLLTISLDGGVQVFKADSGLEVSTEYGNFLVSEPVLIELIKCPAMERLKLISQYGVSCYARKKPDFSRYDHSVGVFILLRRFNASLQEQIAGLLHDVSHTVYSHVGDVLFSHYFNRYSYQDEIHEWFLEKIGVKTILEKYGFEDCCSEHDKKNMRMLEQDKPDLCADRIEYLLRGGMAENLLTQEDVSFIVDDLYFENGLWICKTVESALKIGNTSLWLSEHFFGSAWNAFTYAHAAQALKRALETNLLTLDDIHFSTDDLVWQKLKSSTDDLIKRSIDKVENYDQKFLIGDENNHHVHFKAKFLGVDPWVRTPDGIKRLRSIDYAYYKEYCRVQDIIKRGWYIVHKD